MTEPEWKPCEPDKVLQDTERLKAVVVKETGVITNCKCCGIPTDTESGYCSIQCWDRGSSNVAKTEHALDCTQVIDDAVVRARRRRERLELAGRAMQGMLTHRGDTSMTLVSKAFAIADLMLAEADKEPT